MRASSCSSTARSRATASWRASSASSAATARRSRTSGSRAGPTASRRPARTSARAAAAAGRTCATSGSSSTSSSRCSTRCSASPGCPIRRSSRSCRPCASTPTATSSSTPGRARPRASSLGFHKAGRWEEIVPIQVCLLTGERGNAVREAFRDWARGEGLEAYDQRANTGYLRHLVVREGVRTGELLCILVTVAGDLPGVENLAGAARGARAGCRRRAARRQRRRRRGGQRHPDAAAVRALLVRGGDQRAASARLGRILPADQHRDGRRALPRRDRAGRADRRRDRVGPVLRDGLDRARAGGCGASRDRRRDRPRGDRARARERARRTASPTSSSWRPTPARRRAT